MKLCVFVISSPFPSSRMNVKVCPPLPWCWERPAGASPRTGVWQGQNEGCWQESDSELSRLPSPSEFSGNLWAYHKAAHGCNCLGGEGWLPAILL